MHWQCGNAGWRIISWRYKIISPELSNFRIAQRVNGVTSYTINIVFKWWCNQPTENLPIIFHIPNIRRDIQQFLLTKYWNYQTLISIWMRDREIAQDRFNNRNQNLIIEYRIRLIRLGPYIGIDDDL